MIIENCTAETAAQVREHRLGKGVYAVRNFEVGELIVRCAGEFSRQRMQHSVQIDFTLHLEVQPPVRFVNHSCQPNSGLLVKRGASHVDLFALRSIAAEEELTLDYCTFEQQIDFMRGDCQCGSSACRKRVRGFRDLSPSQIADYGPYIAEYLRGAANGS